MSNNYENIPLSQSSSSNLNSDFEMSNEGTVKDNTAAQFFNKLKSKKTLLVLGITVLVYILFIFTQGPVISFLTPILFGDLSGIGLGGLVILPLVVIITSMLYGWINGLCVYLLMRKVKFFFIGFLIFMTIFITHAAYTVVSSQKYLSDETNRVSKDVEKVVGKEKIILTYLDSVPSYDADNILDKVQVTFDVIAPESGDYLFGADLATPYDLYGPVKQQVPRADTTYKVTVPLAKGVVFKLNIDFDMDPFTKVDYAGDLKLSLGVRRVNLNIKDVAWHKEPVTSFPVYLADSGSSKNFKLSKDSGVEEPVYTIGPFSTMKQGIVTDSSEIIPSIILPAGWKKFQVKELYFFYPEEWSVEVLPPHDDDPKLAQFFTPDPQIQRGRMVLNFSKSTQPILGTIKRMKEIDENFTFKSIKVDGNIGTKIFNLRPGSTQSTMIFEYNDHTYEFFGDEKDNFYQIIGTLKFTK